MAERKSGTVTLMAAGDVGARAEPMGQYAELIAPVLKQADLRFAQCERTYSERGSAPQFMTATGADARSGPGGGHSRLPPRMAEIWNAANIDIISVAGNHAMDWGPEPMLDTIDIFRSMGKHPIGAGRNDEEARAPAIVERNGVKIAFLAYCSVLRDGQAAGPGKVGMAPMRAHTHYAADDFQPASPPVIISVPYEPDLKALEEDIRKAKKNADVVIVSLHWGVRMVEKTIGTYQPPIAHAAIDAGADLILGHHAHCIKAVEVYKGKACFYSIGNFMTTGSSILHPVEWNFVWFKQDPETMAPHGQFNFPSHCRMTMIVKAVISKNGVERLSFLPTFINPRAQPYALQREDPKFQQIVDYAEWVSDHHPHKFRVEGNEVIVETAG